MKKLTYILCAMVVALASLTMTGCASFSEGYLEAQIEEFNKTCPQDVGNGMVINKCLLEETALVYDCSIDPEQYSLEALKESKEDLTKDLIEISKNSYSSDKEIKTLINLVVTAEKNMKYRFNDGSAQSVDIEISKDILAGF